MGTGIAALEASSDDARSVSCDQMVVRRSANYKPSIWNDDFVQSLSNGYGGKEYAGQAQKLKEDVKTMLEKEMYPLNQFQLIDTLQRLGISYLFEDEIDRIFESIYMKSKTDNKQTNEDLYATALEFRLMRQHGYQVPQDVFKSFMDGEGNFKTCLCKDTKGMLCLYEASYLLIEGESILEEARDFTTRHLKELLNNKQEIDEYLAMQVSHALELPLHWRMHRLESRWFIDVYEKRQHMNPALLDLAKLEFNTVQALYQEELKEMSRWYKNTLLADKLSFFRDRLVEGFLWTVGLCYEPQYGYSRLVLTKLAVLITVIDDAYDVYGSLDELELFTDAVKRWDIKAVDQLPEYLQILFLVLFNSINEMAYDALKKHGVNVTSYLQKTWADYCNYQLEEAKWYYSGYKPTLNEYLENSWFSISGPVLLIHAYIFFGNGLTKDALESLMIYPNVIRMPSMVLRLTDDLGTSSDELQRGDIPKSIQCYMHDTGASEEDAREYIKNLIFETWKKINNDLFVESPLSKISVSSSMNIARISHCMYQLGDGHGIPDRESKDRIVMLIIKPIPLGKV